MRCAHNSVRSNYVSKLSVVFKKELRVVSAGSDTLGVGNATCSDRVAQYMTFSMEEQNMARVLVKQVPTLPHCHLAAPIAPLRARLQLTGEAEERVAHTRYTTFFMQYSAGINGKMHSLEPSSSVYYGSPNTVVLCSSSSEVEDSRTKRTTC